MITETGRVVAIERDYLWVETIQRSTCQSCVAEKGCGQKLLSKFGQQAGYLRVLLGEHNPDNFVVGEQVTLGVPERIVANGSLLVYMIPLMTMILAVVVLHTLGRGEAFQILGALVGLLIGGGVVKLHAAQTYNDPEYQPVLLDNNVGIKHC